jgi:hypothetical protein
MVWSQWCLPTFQNVLAFARSRDAGGINIPFGREPVRLIRGNSERPAKMSGTSSLYQSARCHCCSYRPTTPASRVDVNVGPFSVRVAYLMVQELYIWYVTRSGQDTASRLLCAHFTVRPGVAVLGGRTWDRFPVVSLDFSVTYFLPTVPWPWGRLSP